MTRYSNQGERDEGGHLDGDASFTGVMMKGTPDQVAEGYVCEAENMRFGNGVAEPRGGIRKLPWVGQFGTTWPLVFPFDFSALIGFGQVHGAGVFDDPSENGRRWALVAAGGAVYRSLPGSIAERIPLPKGVTLTGRVRFVQAFHNIIMLRGADLPKLVLSDFRAGFELPGAIVAGSGGRSMPDAEWATFWENRLIALDGRDELAVSDVLSPEVTSVAQTVRVNVGSSDPLTGVAAYGTGKLVVAKESSVYVVSDLVADANGRFTGATCKTLTTAWGIIAPGSLVAVGRDMWGLAPHGVVSIRQTEEGDLQTGDTPVSEPIEPLMARLNRELASIAVAAVWDNKFYLAFPMDDGKALGAQMVAAGAYDASGSFALANLEIGAEYRIEFGAHEATFMNLDALPGETRDFVADASTMILTGEKGLAVTCKLWRLHSGVNNAVVVYDLQRQAWCGLDTSDGMMILDWMKLDYQGAERLFFLGADGWINLYEEGPVDEVDRELVTPWTDVVVTERPPVGGTLTVNGVVVTATRGARNTTTGWGAYDLRRAQQNLWDDGYGRGFAPGLARAWSAPDTVAEQIPGGVRFWATSGALAPEVSVSGGSGAWAEVTSLAKRGVIERPIVSRLVTRGYRRGASPSGAMREAFTAARVRVRTWCPDAVVSVRPGGAGGAGVTARILRDRTRYLTVSGHQEAYREDYSVVASDDMGEWEQGRDVEEHQETDVAVELHESGLYLQVEVVNREGRCEVVGAQAESMAGERRSGVIK